MFKWTALLLLSAIVAACLNAMGVGLSTLAKLLLAFSLMVCAALLIAWPFLRDRTH